MTKDLRQLIDAVRAAQDAVNPSANWVAQNRALLLSQIKNTISEKPHAYSWFQAAGTFFVPRGQVYAVVRPVLALVLTFVVGSAGWLSTVSAAHNSLPGDMMYPVKLAAEQTQAAVVEVLQGKAASAELRVSFAGRRAEEVTKITSAPLEQGEKKEKLDAAIAQLKTEVQTINEKLVAAKEGAPAEAKAAAVSMDRQMEVIKTALQEAAAPVTSTIETVAAINQLKQEVEILKQLPDATTSTPASGLVESPTSTPVAPLVQPAPTSSVPAAPRPTKNTTTTEITIKIETEEILPDVVDTSTPVKIEAWE